MKAQTELSTENDGIVSITIQPLFSAEFAPSSKRDLVRSMHTEGDAVVVVGCGNGTVAYHNVYANQPNCNFSLQ